MGTNEYPRHIYLKIHSVPGFLERTLNQDSEKLDSNPASALAFYAILGKGPHLTKIGVNKHALPTSESCLKKQMR